MAEEQPEGVVTVLFTDIVGSAALKTSQGDVAAQDLVRDHFDLLRQQVETHRGREIKTLGDGLMATFVSPRSAVASAIGMQRALADGNRARLPEQQLQLRVGLNAGEAIREDGDLFGSTVDAAARICAKAGGGQILASETVRGILGATKDIQFLDRGRFRLKGFPERWRLLEVAWRQEAAPVAAPVLAERTPYIGREQERAELRRLMEQTIAGHGSIVLIRGEPGVGKTRLAQELVIEARKHGMFDATGRCYEMEGAPPYIPYVEMLQQSLRRGPAGFRTALGENAGEIAKILPELRQVFDDIPPPLELPPEQERMFLFNSIRDFLGRVSHTLPLLHVLDDIHWADDATLMLLQHIAQHQDKMAVLTVATYRDIELDAARPFARTLESLVRQRLAHRIALKPLSETGVEAMLQALTRQPPPAALVQAIYRETEGNPFFVEEVYQHLLEQGRLLNAEGGWRSDLQVGELDVPEGVRLVISRRLERVSEDCRTALTDAAVVGRDFGFELLQKLSDLDADRLLDAIDEAERANLIVASDDLPAAESDRAHEARFRFAHELIRQTLISGLSLPRRQRLHLRVAETMEQVYGRGAEAYAADMAHHLYQAGAGADPAKTARYLVLAGDQALHGAAFGQALRDYDMAFTLQPADDRAARADLLYKRGLARRSLDLWDEALADWREAADAYERLGNVEAAASTFESMCYQLLYGQYFAETLELSLRALTLLGGRESLSRSRMLGWAGLTLSAAGYHAAGLAMLKRAASLAHKLEDDGHIGLELSAETLHHWGYLEVRQGAETGLKGADLLRKAGLLWYLADQLFYTSLLLASAGRLDEASQTWSELAPLAERLGHTVWVGGDYSASPLVRILRTGEIDANETFWGGGSREPGAVSTLCGFRKARCSSVLALFGKGAGRKP
jgi:class 3 adenylate cyclase